MGEANDLLWRPGIEDPSRMSWVIVMLYFISAFCSLYVFMQKEGCHYRPFWSTLALVLLFFGMNKLLCIQSLVAVTGRLILYKYNIYQVRRPLLVCIGSIATAASFILLFLSGRKYGLVNREYSIPLFGVLFLCSLFMIRSISFHYVDWYVEKQIMGIEIKLYLELTGALLIIIGILLELVKTMSIRH
jgi:hypothetical protein